MEMTRKAGVTIFVSDKIDFKSKAIKRERRILYYDKRIGTRR